MKDWSCVGRALQWLEPYAVKIARTVPRGEGGRKAILLPDYMSKHYGLDRLMEHQLDELKQTRKTTPHHLPMKAGPWFGKF